MESCSELETRPWALPALREIRDEGYESWLKQNMRWLNLVGAI
jgi:hypothetical protein